jgi:polyhydroxyalkanoate synthesis regulator phasin
LNKKSEYEQIYYFSYFKKLYESWEESTNKLMDVWMSSPLMERAVEKSSEFKNYIHNFIDNTLEKRYLPEKRDMEKLIDTLDSLGEKIAELEDRITDLQSNTKKPGPKPKPRTGNTKKKVKEKKS